MKRLKLPHWLTPRFSLRTLFVLVTLAALGAWWVNSQLNRIRQRREFALNNPIVLTQDKLNGVTAPGLLWLFGEEGYSEVLIQVVDPMMYEQVRMAWPEEVDDRECLEQQAFLNTIVGVDDRNSLTKQAKRIYPEATRIRNIYLKSDPRKSTKPH